MGVHFTWTVLKLNTSFQITTVKFKMKVLIVCMMAAVLVGMVASTPFPKKTASLNKAGQMSLLHKVSTPKKVQERPVAGVSSLGCYYVTTTTYESDCSYYCDGYYYWDNYYGDCYCC